MKIPFLNIPDKPISAPSQKHLPIADIVDDLVMYKDGGAAIIMETTSLNFGLLSEKEKQAVIAAYAALLNSLSFAIQIIIRSQRKDISNYMEYLDEASNKIQNPKLAGIMTDYKSFVSETIKKKNVLGKRFFIIIPFSSLELGITKSALSIAKKGLLPYPKSYAIKKAKVTLYPKRDHLIRQAGRLSIKLKQLSTSELIELFYDVYNPEMPMTKSKEEII
ncbi:hypothetical protein DRH13_04120 [Candidatus Woesebacteria bacterium]|nr:MAG: hypothetical protein DRH13_04120 [Candidatus Woesebacteria bacterium]